jgi:hypothetical protein
MDLLDVGRGGMDWTGLVRTEAVESEFGIEPSGFHKVLGKYRVS